MENDRYYSNGPKDAPCDPQPDTGEDFLPPKTDVDSYDVGLIFSQPYRAIEQEVKSRTSTRMIRIRARVGEISAERLPDGIELMPLTLPDNTSPSNEIAA